MTKSSMTDQIFIDTSAWIMLLNKSELYHQEAVQVYREISRGKLLTTNLIIGETYTWLRRKAGFSEAIRFYEIAARKAELSQLALIYVDYLLERRAAQILRKYSDHELSFADAVSFALMEQMKVKKAFAYDRHFVTAGFKVVNTIP